MKHYRSYGRRLPRFMARRLFGDRDEYGLEPVVSDPCWREWQERYMHFYEGTQKEGVGSRVNLAGYTILKDIEFSGKTVLEVGPGSFTHYPFWNSTPDHFIVADIHEKFLTQSLSTLARLKVEGSSILMNKGVPLIDTPSESVDIVVSFYSLEHLHPLGPYLDEIKRILKRDGILVGAIPCEGGLGWGMGRFFTSRRWLRKNTSINPDKIICWEHPNFADEILNEMSRRLRPRVVKYWPLGLPSIDANLLSQFVFQRS